MSVPEGQFEDFTLDLSSEHQALAWHEAGHAVAMLLLGQRFDYVTIVPSTRALGHIAFPVEPPDGATARERRRWFADAIVHCYAGGAAESYFWRHDKVSDGDRENAWEFAALLHPRSFERSERALVEAGKRSSRLVERAWREIEVLAQALLVRKTIDWEEARRLVMEVPSAARRLR